MPLVTSKELLLKAQKEGYAVGAFNAENMEMVQAIVDAAERLVSPVMIQTTPSTVKYGGIEYFYANAAVAAKNAKVPVVLHLDHGESFEMASQAYRAGYTSIMIDGSHFSFDENVTLTKKVVEMCSPCGIPVEAELGKVGGKEDDLDGGEGSYTSPEDAKKFVELTNADSLAIAIGTAHGVYKTAPKLDLDRLREIRKAVDIPLVLHGGTGIADDVIRECIKSGISKVNFATELRIAYTKGVKEAISSNPDVIDVKVYSRVGRDNVKNLVMEKMNICGSVNKAF